MTFAAVRGPLVPARILARLLQPAIDSDGIEAVADRIGISPRQIMRWRSGEAERATFDIADRIIVDVLNEPALWYLDPELAAVYEEIT